MIKRGGRQMELKKRGFDALRYLKNATVAENNIVFCTGR